jgi:hypothetical protein
MASIRASRFARSPVTSSAADTMARIAASAFPRAPALAGSDAVDPHSNW